ncbi:metal-sensitive transcriptional regulator [Yinghuangia sp. ASG 101]|uniref:metal-sensitive transcriptional regulator n=1 Tax=Yinghuangia sp. ASG 101 TaxID=2896848 RepID=UPI001E32EB58|nr:metal-sensitive transcriptional regulator [Yinghuangia sp. ASG 101]UGQ14929.1 metal-sensitive transcriptional regulator [Yinghuangia sp. ASG 101]
MDSTTADGRNSGPGARSTAHDADAPPAGHGEHAGHGYSPRKDEHLKRLRRIEGQVRGLQRMVSEDEYCIDVLTQVSAATKALQAFALSMLDEHLAHCVAHAVEQGGPEADAKVKEASQAIARLVRS